MLRWTFALAGIAALGWGAWLAWEFAARVDSIQAALWLVGGPVVHDALVAPVVGVVGLALARFVPVSWRAPVAVGAVLSAVLGLLALPVLFRPYGVATNPGLHDADYVLGLSVALGMVWVGVTLGGAIRHIRKTDAARGRARG